VLYSFSVASRVPKTRREAHGERTMSRKPIKMVLLLAVACLPASAGAEAQPKSGTKAVSGPAIALECRGPGLSEHAYRDHIIKNTSTFELPRGTRVFWRASNGGSGMALLDAELLPGATVRVTEAGRTKGYACTARFYAGSADLAIRAIQWAGATTASLEIVNLNPWVDAPASVLKLQAFKCRSTEVSSVDSPVGVIERAGVRTLTLKISKSGADYLQATANATETFAEDDRLNNVRRSAEFLQNKRCSPK